MMRVAAVPILPGRSLESAGAAQVNGAGVAFPGERGSFSLSLSVYIKIFTYLLGEREVKYFSQPPNKDRSVVDYHSTVTLLKQESQAFICYYS